MYRSPQIAPVKVRIRTVDFHRLVPDNGLETKFWLPDEFDESRLVLGIHEAKGMNPKPLHEAEGARNCTIRHDPHDHVHGFRCQTDEIPEIIVCRLRLRKSPVRFLLDGMNHIGKSNGILDEEDRNIIAYEIPVAFLGVNLNGEAAHIASKIERPFRSCDGGKPDENWHFSPTR